MIDEVNLLQFLLFLHLSLFQYNDRIKNMERNNEKEVKAKVVEVNERKNHLFYI